MFFINKFKHIFTLKNSKNYVFKRRINIGQGTKYDVVRLLAQHTTWPTQPHTRQVRVHWALMMSSSEDGWRVSVKLPISFYLFFFVFIQKTAILCTCQVKYVVMCPLGFWEIILLWFNRFNSLRKRSRKCICLPKHSWLHVSLA